MFVELVEQLLELYRISFYLTWNDINNVPDWHIYSDIEIRSNGCLPGVKNNRKYKSPTLTVVEFTYWLKCFVFRKVVA